MFFSGPREIYIEIAEKYKEYIKTGILCVGDKLPSVRQAALEFGVNPNTVARSYSLLEEWGYIKSIPKKGVYVDSVNGEEKVECYDFRADIRKMRACGISKEELIKQIEEVYCEND